jgi:transketolase
MVRSEKNSGGKSPIVITENSEENRKLKLEALRCRRMLLDLGWQQGIRLHYGAMMSCMEILTLLYFYWMRIDPANPEWQERDRFILSKGHAAPSLYAVLMQAGYFPRAAFETFRTVNSILQGHPDRNKTPGIDCTTGSLGQGFAVACGMALAAQIDQAPYRVYALISDGECNEGSIWEAAMIAANQDLGHLIAILDWNKKSSYGPMAGRNDIEPLADKWRAFGWSVAECDGHDFVSLAGALHSACADNNPTVLLCRTVKGKGIPWAEKTNTRSNFFLEGQHYREARKSLDALEAELTNGSSD